MRALSSSRLGATDALNLNGDGGVCVRACASACVRDVFAIYDNNISPRLIMIIIKIIIVYFIQIRHTDHFPSTGTSLYFCVIIRSAYDTIRIIAIYVQYISKCIFPNPCMYTV